MSGWLRYLALNARARTGFSRQIAIWAIITIIAAMVAMAFFLLAAFVWLADRYSAVTAGLVLGFLFLLVALIALLACLLARRRNIERARLELAARGGGWLDPKLLAMGFQLGQSIGWRKLVALAAVALVTAGLAREWMGGAPAPPEDGDQ
jgi:predicted lysophospholipase L1 biosynthesis ABC-type transport system permease subunit